MFVAFYPSMITTNILLLLLSIYPFILEDMKGIQKLWILGDNFVAESYRKSLRKAHGEFFIKENFEFLPFYGSRYSDSNNNTLSRLVNSFMQAMNSKFYLPEFVIIFLDNDLIEHLQYKKLNTASLLGPWIEYLSQTVAEALHQRYQDLPLKAWPKEVSQIYWVEAVGHNNFDYSDQKAREIFTQCLEANCKLHENMRILKIRHFWDKSDDSLVVNNRFTKAGLFTYWRSMDASFCFNTKKQEDFLVRSKFRALKSQSDEQLSGKRFGKTSKSFADDIPEVNDVQCFFNKRRLDKYHWNHSQISATQVLLPKPK